MATKPLSLLEKLKESGLNSTDQRKLKMVELSPKRVKALASNYRELMAIKLPYFNLDGSEQRKFHRIRYLEKPKVMGKEVKDFRKYDQPAHTLPSLYFPPFIDWVALAQDPETPIFVTEGEFKAACATKLGFPAIGLGGVYSWKSKKHNLEHLPEFELLNWRQRTVYIVFDSDLKTNSMVQLALYDLSVMLTNLGAKPLVVNLPDAVPGKTGLDDFLVAKGRDSFEALLPEAGEFQLAKDLWRMNSEVVYIDQLQMILRRRDNMLMTRQAFVDLSYANWHMMVMRGDKLQEKQTAKEWLKWPERAVVNHLVYEPGIQGPTDTNNWSMWPGWGCEPKKGDLAPWHEMMKYVFDRHKEELDWFHRWLAIQVQRPGVKLHTAVCLWSRKQGTGKGLIGETLMRIFGQNSNLVDWYTLQNARNDWAQHKQFVIGDEITGSDHRAIADRIKNLITQETIIIDQKYVKPYTCRDTINYYFTSNHPNAFYIDEEDRRLFIWAIDKDPLPLEFYIKFRDWKENSGPAALFQYLLEYPLGDFDEKTRAMKTKYHHDMVSVNKSDLEEWVTQLLVDPDTALESLNHQTRQCDLYTAGQLKEIYEQSRGFHNRITAQGMGLALRRLGLQKVNQGKAVRTNVGLCYLFPIRQHDVWGRAPHNKLADHYNQYFGAPSSSGKKERRRKF